ncbi:bifunctional 2-polyprenyl-6-hydroxyphenol methylase/3-demethylubiquinol 3-O-methyltransferase UbiG [Alteriqipengyuania flavescens]|uniref:bifunctional 2-polyprenyl-6-hydroxyphenol methylase/3-demethylubiquinol 3-O-methyltransferase UbiG n=1 Tax=Alteriqipengyuania flavescens TaxID=3053610 RepID=UPI0025B457D8|nr:bifunctional 2-polyprenyl-6-hydroxyphenol methylase/3-demethylubiquinol 3-O-methyltransferase UbiG [Alteriqipengyuania flavescens]WJY19816.1 bifunctional 2-polyprenyl-6-hydroxyphenol methylase/3-demethylubiquinol 3-O-methyltransferase UbiG [Alteriqipengyuania flavescens]WJY25758.1 bifunctional 2-polyprenyl-6-hydroxyphenol methylase/3-demethylubiquinol 3-O-methyltransferase UbiG [Alteriqipengyuania flavescens]
MANANVSGATSGATIRPDEAQHFGALARDWWDPMGSSAMLHRLNPVRLGFIREAVDIHFGSDAFGYEPLSRKSALDVGCGAGLLCEPLARLGADVTGVDAAAQNVAVAQAHADAMGLAIAYRHGELGELGLGQFDLVTSMEVIEHVADKGAFIAALTDCVADDGLLVLSTPNRTLASRALLVGAAEAVGAVPRGTHHWEDFITPDELEQLLHAAGFTVTDCRGIAFNPAKGFTLSANRDLNYILSARRA